MADPTDEERPYCERFGADLRLTRLEVGLTRPELARRADLSPGHVLQLETGKRRTRPDTVRRLARVLSEASYGDIDETDLCASFLQLLGDAIANDLPAERLAKRRRRSEKRLRNVEAVNRRAEQVTRERLDRLRDMGRLT